LIYSYHKCFYRESVSQESAKKRRLLALTAVLFKIYFKSNNLKQCESLINVINSPRGIAKEDYRYLPIADVVMYNYFVGRLRTFEDKHEEARSASYCNICRPF
jgi:hypothetical protein